MNKPRFANILFDETFKIVVGAPGNEPLLIRLIETLIPGKKIRSLERLDKENHGLVISDKNTTFDLFCTSEAGEQFIVEMQFAEQETYRERMLFTATELAGMTQEQRREYDKTMTTKIDIIEQQETARKRGLKEGMEKGRLEERVATAKRLRELGVSPDIIAQATGMSVEEVNAL